MLSVLTGGTAASASGEREAIAGLGWAAAGLASGDDHGPVLGRFGRGGLFLFFFCTFPFSFSVF